MPEGFTSLGSGASFGGLAALLGTLKSCGSGVTVVNIDNGFGADWTAAEDAFLQCLQVLPADRPAQVFLDRLARLRDRPSGEPWDGVWRFTTK